VEISKNYDKVLETLQAGILKSDGRKYRAYIFVKFSLREKYERNDLRKFISSLFQGARKVTTYEAQLADTRMFKDVDSHPGIPIINAAFTISCYQKILSDLGKQLHPGDLSFRRGMGRSRKRLGDYTSWIDSDKGVPDVVDPFYYYDPSDRRSGNEIDLLIMVGHSDEGLCRKVTKEFTDLLDGDEDIVKSYHVENGFQKYDEKEDSGSNPKLKGWRNEKRQPLSPLGYRDGFSNPTSLKYLFDKVLVKEEWTKEKNYGTYLAFRKTEVRENVFDDRIKKAIEDIKDQYKKENAKLPKDAALKEYAEALFMGRFKNGTPLALSSKPLDEEKWRVNGGDLPFDYENDITGLVCPLGAHVRSMNPEGTELNTVGIVRRGMLYEEAGEGQKTRSGLLFVSCQNSLTKGFEVLFDRMKIPNNVDPILYRPEPSNYTPFFNTFRAAVVPKSTRQIDLTAGGAELTVFRGGEYFFMPSVQYLNSLR